MEKEKRREILDFLEQRFGIEAAALEDIELLERGIHIWGVARSPELPQILSWKVETPGIRLLRRTNYGFKPTTFGLQVIGGGATRNVVHLTQSEANRFAKGETIQGPFDVSPGYVIVRVDEFVLGCGLYKADGRLLSQMPKYVWAEVRPEP